MSIARNLKVCTEFSFTKNVIPLTDLPPRPNVTWDKYLRVRRHLEIWNNPQSIVHRLPKHFQDRLWKNLLSDPEPVHYRPPKSRYYWDTKRLVELEAENYPILPEYSPEQDQGLWGGEGIVKGYIESGPFIKKKILPRQWIPHFWFPDLKKVTLYSEVIDKHLLLTVTERTMRLIDDCFGFDFYLLRTPDVDINSQLGMKLKRIILISLAKADYYSDDSEKHDYICRKYADFVIPLEEAEWYGLDLNEACRKLQDIEDNSGPQPLKYIFESEMVKQFLEEFAQTSTISPSSKSSISALKNFLLKRK